jgi:hypothetical protein
MSRPARIRWTCTIRATHEHRTWLGAWICGLFQWIGWRTLDRIERLLTRTGTLHCPSCKTTREIRVRGWRRPPDEPPSMICGDCWRAMAARTTELRTRRRQGRGQEPRLH